MRNDIDLETPATLVWLKARQEPQPDLFEEAAADRPNAPVRWDHFWVAVSYVMNIDWRGGRGPWIKVDGRVLKSTDLRGPVKERVGEKPWKVNGAPPWAEQRAISVKPSFVPPRKLGGTTKQPKMKVDQG